MNRRAFLHLLGLAGLSAVMPSFEKDEETMYTFSELLLKISDGQPLSDTEREALRQHAIRVDEVSNVGKAWQNIDGKINNSFLNLPIETIYSRTLEQSVQSLDVVIPSKYNTLLIVANGRTDRVADNYGIRILFNDDVGANYSQQRLAASNATVLASQVFSANNSIVGNFNGSTASAEASAGFMAFVTNIRSNTWKSMYGLSALGEQSATTTALVVTTNVWKSDEPIRKLTFQEPDSNNIVAGSYFGIYGIV